MKSTHLFAWICMYLLVHAVTPAWAQDSNGKPAIGSTLKFLEAQTGHLNYLVVDSALKVGDSSIYIVYSTVQDPYNYIYSTDGPLLINGRSGIPIQNTYINSFGGAMGIGYLPTSLPNGPKLAVNGSSFFAGNMGINRIPPQNIRLAVVAPGGETALEIAHMQTTGYGYSIRDIVSHPFTKAIAVSYNDNNSGTPDPENFIVLGNGITNIGGYQETAQLSVQSAIDIGCRVKVSNPLPGKVAYLAEVPNNESKALSIINTSNPSSPKEVYRVSGAGVAWMQEVRVRLAPFPDYVFDADYPLMDLHALDRYIQEHHRLPGMPSAKEIDMESANLGELVRLQQEKIEELTLHLISLQKSLDTLRASSKQ